MKKIITLCLSLCMTAALAAPAYALEYSIDAPDDYDFGRNTSIEVIHTADGGAMRNEDVSKNAALIPPIFGSESMNARSIPANTLPPISLPVVFPRPVRSLAAVPPALSPPAAW